MTNPPDQPFRGSEFPPLEQSAPRPDPYAPVDYPTNYPPLPPPVYPAAGYPAAYPGYVDPYDPYRALRPQGTNGKAITALVLSLVGFACCGLVSPLGLIFGIIGMRETKRTGQEGYGMALAGAIVGGVSTALIVLVILIYVVLFLIYGAAAFSTY